MSYVRFSSYDPESGCSSDVYVFESETGFAVCVAGRRSDMKVIPIENYLTNVPESFLEAYNKQREMVKSKEYKDSIYNINFPHAKGSFNFETPTEAAEFLKELRSLGYRVPQYAIDALLDEDEENRAKRKLYI